MGSLCPSLPRVLSPAAPLSGPPGVHLKSFSLRSLLSAPILDSLASRLKEPLGSPSALACGTGVKLRPPHLSPAALEKKGSLSNPTWSLWGALSPHSPTSPVSSPAAALTWASAHLEAWLWGLAGGGCVTARETASSFAACLELVPDPGLHQGFSTCLHPSTSAPNFQSHGKKCFLSGACSATPTIGNCLPTSQGVSQTA